MALTTPRDVAGSRAMTDLPAIDQPQSYVVVGPDDQRGPYTLELLVSEVVEGRLDENTPVWWPGLADWTTMAAHPGVAAEIARRRGGPDAATPMAFAPPTAPPPPQEPATAQPEPVQSEPTPEPVAPDDGVAMAAGGGIFGIRGESESTDAIEVPAVDVTPADFEAVDAPMAEDGFRAAGAGEGLDPVHTEAFSELIRRSRARADAASIVENVDSALVAAVDAGAVAEGFNNTARSDAGERHELSYTSPESVSLVVRLGKVHGRDLATGGAEVPFEASVSSSSYGGELDAGSGRHGEVVVVATEHAIGASASVELILGLSDYVDAGYEVDSQSLERDARAVVATLVHRLRT
jgi:hypothetical protein